MREPSDAARIGGHGSHVCPSGGGDVGSFWRLLDAAFGASVRSDGRRAAAHSLQ